MTEKGAFSGKTRQHQEYSGSNSYGLTERLGPCAFEFASGVSEPIGNRAKSERDSRWASLLQSNEKLRRKQTMQNADLLRGVVLHASWSEGFCVGERQMQSHGATTVIAIGRLLYVAFMTKLIDTFAMMQHC